MKDEPALTAVVDADRLARHGLVDVLTRNGFSVAAEMESVSRLCQSMPSDSGLALAIVDYGTSQSELRQSIEKLHRHYPGVSVVVLTQTLDTDVLLHCFDGGADGYLLKSITSDALVASLTLVLSGERVYPSDLISEVLKGRVAPAMTITPSATENISLSRREQQILRWLVGGLSNKAIARQLEITEPTVKVHLQSLLKKLNVENRTQAAVWAIRSSSPAASGGLRARVAQDSKVGKPAARPLDTPGRGAAQSADRPVAIDPRGRD